MVHLRKKRSLLLPPRSPLLNLPLLPLHQLVANPTMDVGGDDPMLASPSDRGGGLVGKGSLWSSVKKIGNGRCGLCEMEIIVDAD